MAPQPGDIVFYGSWVVKINAIALRQRRGMCARLAFGDGSGWWVEIEKLQPFGSDAHAWQTDE